jgi:hypothetical protein
MREYWTIKIAMFWVVPCHPYTEGGISWRLWNFQTTCSAISYSKRYQHNLNITSLKWKEETFGFLTPRSYKYNCNRVCNWKIRMHSIYGSNNHGHFKPLSGSNTTFISFPVNVSIYFDTDFSRKLYFVFQWLRNIFRSSSWQMSQWAGRFSVSVLLVKIHCFWPSNARKAHTRYTLFYFLWKVCTVINHLFNLKVFTNSWNQISYH